MDIDELSQHVLDAVLVDDFRFRWATWLGLRWRRIIPLGNFNFPKRNASSLPTSPYLFEIPESPSFFYP
ncbi:hypothetical protein ULG90_21480 [Halopseudomonas pachastrellae]|nr:hypothetical protein ULG90_21480 [Halopseudomonas pachastrellae]